MILAPLAPRPTNAVRVAAPAADGDTHAQPPKGRRASKPRSRLGCLTCKKRRVKCDERNPVCLRCEQSHVACHGFASYRPTTHKPQPAKPPLHTLAPRTNSTAGPSNMPARTPFLRSFTGFPFIRGKSVPYFDMFRHYIAPDLSRYNYVDLWSSVVYEGMQDGFIRESILAIGALAIAISSRSSGFVAYHRSSAIAPWSSDKITNHHHRASLLHHLKAVSGFRRSIQSGLAASTPRRVLMMTLVLIVYEILQGNLAAADGILSCGLGVLRDSITLFQGSNLIREEIEDMEHVLPGLAITGVFTHQLNGSWTHILQLRAEPDCELPEDGIYNLKNVFERWRRFYTLAMTSLCQTAHGSSFPVFEMVARRGSFFVCLRRWKSKLQEYLQNREIDAADKRSLHLILLHWQVIWVSFSCCLDHTGVSFDAFTNEFRDILRRCIKFIEDDFVVDAPRLMTFGEGILMPLLCVVTCCRDHDLRMTAAAVAYELPWKEGTWDTRVVLLGQLGSVLMEEKGRDENGFIPPSERWYWRGGDISPKSRRMKAMYLRNLPGENGAVTKTLNIDLDRWPDICSAVGCQTDHAQVARTFQ